MKEIEIHFKGGDGKKIKTLPEVPDNSDYVDLLTSQNIDGKKNFTQTPTINGKDITTQEKLNEVSNSKQNTLTAGTGISIENDTISVTDAGGLTVLRQSDFPLSADLLAKVKANPQNYCLSLKNDYSQDETFYYNRTTSTEIQYLGYYTTQYIVNALTHIGAEIRLSDGSLSVKVGNSVLFHIQSATNDFGIDKNTIRTIGVFAKTNNQTLSGDDLYLATTIDIGDDD